MATAAGGAASGDTRRGRFLSGNKTRFLRFFCFRLHIHVSSRLANPEEICGKQKPLIYAEESWPVCWSMLRG